MGRIAAPGGSAGTHGTVIGAMSLGHGSGATGELRLRTQPRKGPLRAV